MKKPIIYTKQTLIDKLKEIYAIGWIPNARKGNHGGIGNTLEDLLGIKENNLPIPNAAEWELKSQRIAPRLLQLYSIRSHPQELFVSSRKSFYKNTAGRIKRQVSFIPKTK